MGQELNVVAAAGTWELCRAVLRDVGSRGRVREKDKQRVLRATMEWLCRAQDATPDGGVSRQFHLRRGWLPSYPETTGYIIETFHDFAARTRDDAYATRALRMGEWLLEERLEDGSTYGGGAEAPTKSPAIFNTGMTLFGFVRTYQATKDSKFREAVERAARFLVDSQDEDGAWRRNLSRFATGDVHVYNTRTAWALALAGRLLNDDKLIEAAARNCEWALNYRNELGWFDHNDLSDDGGALTHTIAYAYRGLLETGTLIGRDDWIDLTAAAARAWTARQWSNGGLAGSFDAKWNPVVKSSCLTGCAQMSIILFRLFELTSSAEFLDSAQRMVSFVAATQDIDSPNPGIRGGVKGSDPLWGDYNPHRYLNWAAKFQADALMLEAAIAETASR